MSSAFSAHRVPGDEPPLHGVRIVDLSRVLAGPYATMLLADLGADVVKVERPGTGDETRTWGPPFVASEAAYYLAVNRGKRSVALDLRDPAARAAVLRLAAGADVVIENFRPGGAASLGVSYEDVRKFNPRIVYCSISGFGAREPTARAGYDFIVQAESGLMSITGARDGPPAKIGVALVDVLTGLNVVVAVLAALRRRDRSGRGERLEVSLLDSALSALVNVAQNVLTTGEEAGRYGNAHPSIAPYEPLQARDGWVAIAAANDGLFAKLCTTIDRPDLLADPRYATNASRVANRAELASKLEQTLGTRSVADWVERLVAAGVPAGSVRGVRDALAAARASGDSPTLTVDHPVAGPLEVVRTAPRFETSVRPTAAAPPLLGQHTGEVLRELGLDHRAIDALLRRQEAPPGEALEDRGKETA